MRLGACFTAAALVEVCIYPSPGLVSPQDTGAHDDMNLHTFVIGSSVLAPYFTAFARLGREYRQRPAKELFTALRHLGVSAEHDLLQATAGINTQRGQLFLLGLAAGLAGWSLARGQQVPSEQFYLAVKQACEGLSSRELGSLQIGEAKTNGQRMYLVQGETGVRGEAEAGFPAVRQVGYPCFEDGLRRGLSLNDAAVHALISIMAVLQDTTVWGRLGQDGIVAMQSTATQILSLGSVFTEQGRSAVLQAHTSFSTMRLSPGGAADLLSLSMALYFIDHGFPGPEVLLVPSLFAR